MDDELASRKARLLNGLHKIEAECRQLAEDANYFNGLPQSGKPIDLEATRVLAHAAREALKCVQADEPIPERCVKVLWPTK